MKSAPANAHCGEERRAGTTNMGPAVGSKLWREALSPEMLSPRMARGVRSFCPRFAAMSDADKRAFWAYTFQALAGAEAGLKPTTDVRHTEPEVAVQDTVTKRMVRSEGLLQLTYMDATRYGCDFDWQQDKSLPEKDPAKTILQPSNNLLCGVKILGKPDDHSQEPLLTHRATGLLSARAAELPGVRQADDECAGSVPPARRQCKKQREPRGHGGSGCGLLRMPPQRRLTNPQNNLSDPYRHDRLFVLTGAGISAESGLATFRGSGGLVEWLSGRSSRNPGRLARRSRTCMALLFHAPPRCPRCTAECGTRGSGRARAEARRPILSLHPKRG